ncbi:MAG TPA: hypothetical protein VGL13_14150, partial [Polyangiaceae bacterium]
MAPTASESLAPAPVLPATPTLPPLTGASTIDDLVNAALAQGNKLPGCVVVVGRRAGIVYEKAFG